MVCAVRFALVKLLAAKWNGQKAKFVIPTHND